MMRQKESSEQQQPAQPPHSTATVPARVMMPSSPSSSAAASPPAFTVTAVSERTSEAARQLFCGGAAGAVAKTVTAPFSRLTILFQVHSMVTSKSNRPKFAMTFIDGWRKMVDRGGILSLWKGNLTSVLHRFPYSAINFYIYENTLDVLSARNRQPRRHDDNRNETERQLVRRMTRMVMKDVVEADQKDLQSSSTSSKHYTAGSLHGVPSPKSRRRRSPKATHGGAVEETTPALHKFAAGALAGTVACLACYPLDLVRTRLTTQFEGQEHYRGIQDAFVKIARQEGAAGFYSGVLPTLLVAVPNFAISYTVYGTLKEYTLDDELFYNLRRIDAASGEPKLGFGLTILCGATSGTIATLVTFPMDTIRRRMQIQSLHVEHPEQRLNFVQIFTHLYRKEGLGSLYRGLTPELLKVIPMVGTMFFVYEWTKDLLNVRHVRNG